MKKALPVMRVSPRPLRNASRAPTSCGVPPRPTGYRSILRLPRTPRGPVTSSPAKEMELSPGLLGYHRHRDCRRTDSAITRVGFPRLALWLALRESITTSCWKKARLSNFSPDVVASAALPSSERVPRRRPDGGAMTTHAPRFAMIQLDCWSTSAVPATPTAKIAAGDA